MNIQENVDNFVAPNGRQFKIAVTEVNPAFVEIVYADGKAGELPAIFHNHKFTKKPLAEKYLKTALQKFWDEADSKIANKRA
jgi:hypothetical protein